MFTRNVKYFVLGICLCVVHNPAIADLTTLIPVAQTEFRSYDFDFGGDTLLANSVDNPHIFTFYEPDIDGVFKPIQAFTMGRNNTYYVPLVAENVAVVLSGESYGSANKLNLFRNESGNWNRYGPWDWPLFDTSNDTQLTYALSEDALVIETDMVLYIHRIQNNALIPEQEIVISATGGSYVSDLEIHNNTLVASVETNSNTALPDRVTHIFSYNGNRWDSVQQLTPDTAFRYRFDMSIHGDDLLLAAGEKLYFFSRDYTGTWVVTKEYENTLISDAVVLSANRALVSSYPNLYYFEKHPSGEWLERGYIGTYYASRDLVLGDNYAGITENGTTYIITMPALKEQSYCVDTDGDGWGWNGSGSCLIGHTKRGTCEDSDGDYWGWNGMGSCKIPR